jgi:uncharacterized protein (DUF885 family)
MRDLTVNRRQTLQLLCIASATALLPGRTAHAATLAETMLDETAWRLLETDPEQATSLGVDNGAHAALRSRLKDRSQDGVAKVAALLRSDLDRIAALPEEGLDPATRTSLAVVRSAYGTALEGFALPYGDVAVAGATRPTW